MKQKTSKYLAALIIVLGLIFIYFIPNCHGQNSPAYFLEDIMVNILNSDNKLLLIENIQLDKNNMMSGVITAVSNDTDHPFKNKIGQSRMVGPFIKCCGNTTIPDAVVIVIRSNKNEIRYFASNGKILSNKMSIDAIKDIIKNGR